MRRPDVGEKLYLPSQGKYSKEGEEVEVVRVGKKYFYVKRYGREEKFSIDTWFCQNGFGATTKLYNSKEEYDKELEKSRLYREIKEDYFRYHSAWATLEKLQKIKEIIDEVPEKS